MRRRERWPPPAPISPRGRWAGLTTGSGLLIAGLAHTAGTVNELTSCPGGPVGSGRNAVDAQAVCDMVGAVAGLWFLMSLAVVGSGALIVYRVLVRPISPAGASGWIWGWCVLSAIGGAIAVTRIANHTCPEGFRLDELFAVCIAAEDRVAATTNIPIKSLLAISALVVGLVLARSRWVPASVASAVTLMLWLGGMGWLLFDTVGQDWLG